MIGHFTAVALQVRMLKRDFLSKGTVGVPIRFPVGPHPVMSPANDPDAMPLRMVWSKLTPDPLPNS